VRDGTTPVPLSPRTLKQTPPGGGTAPLIDRFIPAGAATCEGCYLPLTKKQLTP